MITEIEHKILPGGERYSVFRGLSTDSKPTDVCNGSSFYEMDTKKTYYFNGASNAWVEEGA